MSSARQICVKTPAIFRSTSSPKLCPYVSLIDLKRSTSAMTQERGRPRRREAGCAVEGRLDHDLLLAEPHLHERMDVGRIVDDENLFRHGTTLGWIDSLRSNGRARSANRLRP